MGLNWHARQTSVVHTQAGLALATCFHFLTVNRKFQMPAQIFGAEAVVVMLNRAFNDQSPSNAVFMNQVAAAGTTTDSQTAFALQFGAGYAGMTADALSTKLLSNLGVLPNAALQTALKDYITAAGVSNVGIIAMQLGQILSGLENATGDQAGFAAAAVAWNNEVTASYNYSANPANTSAGPTGPDDTASTGVTVILTSTADFVAPNASEAKFKTTANNDTIQATAANDLLVSSDVIDGGAGKDTLNALLKAATPTAPTVSNVEIINLTLENNVATNEFNAANVTGAQQIWAIASGTATENESVTFTNVDKAFTVGIKGSGAAGVVTAVVGFKATQVAGTADTGNIALGGTGAATTVTVDSVETVALSSLTASNTLVLNGDSLENITVTGDKALTLTTGAGATLKSFDSTAATGAVTFTSGALTQTTVSVKSGAGADTLDLQGAGQKITIDAGAGNDTVAFDANKAHSITLGAGNDTLQLNAVGAITVTTAATVAASAVSVTDFVVGTDKVKVGGVVKTLTGTQFSTVAGSADLKAAATAASTAAALGANEAVFFQFGADTYVLRDDGVAGLTATDSLIKLTGVTSSVGDTILVA